MKPIRPGGPAATRRRGAGSAAAGYVVDTLEAAVWSVGGAADFEEAIVTATNLGDDADTVAAVAGQIAGARWGVGAIPDRWLARLAWCDEITDLAIRLYAIGCTSTT